MGNIIQAEQPAPQQSYLQKRPYPEPFFHRPQQSKQDHVMESDECENPEHSLPTGHCQTLVQPNSTAVRFDLSNQQQARTLKVRFKKKLIEVPLQRVSSGFVSAGHAADRVIEVLSEKYGATNKTRDSLLLFGKDQRLVKIDRRARVTPPSAAECQARWAATELNAPIPLSSGPFDCFFVPSDFGVDMAERVLNFCGKTACKNESFFARQLEVEDRRGFSAKAITALKRGISLAVEAASRLPSAEDPEGDVVFAFNTESKVREIVRQVLQTVSQHEKVFIESERKVPSGQKGRVFKPDFELVNADGTSSSVIEVKKLLAARSGRGRASKANFSKVSIEAAFPQNILQLRSCCVHQKVCNLFGVVTNGQEWIFTSYDLLEEVRNEESGAKPGSRGQFQSSRKFTIFDVYQEALVWHEEELTSVLRLLRSLQRVG